MTLLQAATTVAVTTTNSLGTVAVQFAIAIIMALTVWQVATLNLVRKDMQAIKQWVYGINGDDGANARLGAVERAYAAQELELQNLKFRTDNHGERIRALEPERRHADRPL